MKTISAELKTLLYTSKQFAMADLYTFSLLNGTILRYTSADIPITYNGNTYSPFKLSRGQTRLVVGVEVDSLDVSIYAGLDDIINGVPYPQFASNGGFDGSGVELDRVFSQDWNTAWAGHVNLFSGFVSEVSPSRTEIKLIIKSKLELLNVQIPKNLYQAGCLHTLYDEGCGAIKASFGTSKTSLYGSTKNVIICGLTQADGYFDLGTITWTSGQNNGLSATIKFYTTGQLILSTPMMFTPALGDSFTAYAGCDRKQATCTNRFNNLSNFRGFPYIPIPESAL